MAFVINDRVKETTTTTGTGTLTLDGAATGFETFSGALGNTNTTYYAIVSQNSGDFEVGIGTVGAGTLSRDTVISSSNSDALVNFAAGTKDVFVTLPASKAIILNDSGTVDLSGDLDLNSNDITGTGNINITGTIESSGNITGTLATAAQPNITSVGTLTGFTSTGIDDNATSTVMTVDDSQVTFSENIYISKSINSVLRLESTAGGIGSGTTIGAIQFYGNDGSVPGPGLKASIVAKTVASLGDDAQLMFTTSDGSTNNINRMLIANNGDISFYEDTGTTPKFFWDASTERLGIGTTSPDVNLHISGSSSVIKFTDEANSQSWQWQAANDRFEIRDVTQAVERFTVLPSGNVGIGTISPAVSLDINNTDSIKIPVGTTAQRPGSPANGMVRFNSDLDNYEVYNSPNWETLLTNNNYTVEYLVVAGGGGGGQGQSGSNNSGSGGGAGGYRCSVPGENSGGGASAEPLLVVREGQSYTVTVGAGGAGGFVDATPTRVVATKGNDSVFGPITSIGGGRGISITEGNGAETNGGSGGGANYVASGAVDGGGGSGTAGQGFAGGQAQVNAGGGGGGAGSIGNSQNGSPARAGGDGVASSITGSSVTRAVGGKGAATSSSAPDTTGDGSGGAAKITDGTTGNGTGQSGQAGVVIIRYLGIQRGSGGTVSTSGDYTIHTFTSSGTYTG